MPGVTVLCSCSRPIFPRRQSTSVRRTQLGFVHDKNRSTQRLCHAREAWRPSVPTGQQACAVQLSGPTFLRGGFCEQVREQRAASGRLSAAARNEIRRPPDTRSGDQTGPPGCRQGSPRETPRMRSRSVGDTYSARTAAVEQESPPLLNSQLCCRSSVSAPRNRAAFGCWIRPHAC